MKNHILITKIIHVAAISLLLFSSIETYAKIYPSLPNYNTQKITASFPKTKEISINRTSGKLLNDGFVWNGRDSTGKCFLTLVRIGGDFRGSLITPDENYRINGSLESINLTLAEKNIKACAGCINGSGLRRDPRSGAQSSHAWRKSDAGQIDLMVIYPTEVKNDIGSLSQTIAEIETAVADANLCFRNSLVELSLRLVHIAETSYVPSGNLDIDLDRLTEKNDGFLDEIHNLRDQYGADIVTLLSTDSNSGGLAKTMTFPSINFEKSAFNVCVWDQITAPSYTLAHEIGHNLGCLHNREDVTYPQESVGYDYGAFAYGKRWFEDSKGYRTIMSYNDGAGSYQNSVPFFSNPNVSYLGVPTGNDGTENNARALSLSAPYASNFRKAVVQGFLPSLFSLDVRSGSHSSLKLRLAVEPLNDINVTLTLQGGQNFQIGSPSNITFNSSNWNLGVPVLVYAKKVTNAPLTDSLTFSASSFESVEVALALIEANSTESDFNYYTGVVVNEYGVPIQDVEFTSPENEVLFVSDLNGTFGHEFGNSNPVFLNLKKDGYTFEPSVLSLNEESMEVVKNSFVGTKPSIVYVNESSTGRNDGTSWVNAYTNLNDALNEQAPISEIWVAAGTYYPGEVRSSSFVLPGGIKVLGGFYGNEKTSSARNYTQNETILSGDIGIIGNSSDNSYHVIVALDGAVLDGFVIQDGNASENFTDSRGVGAGLWAESVNFDISNCEFKNHWAYQGGAAIWISESNATLTNCSFVANQAGTTGKGGAIRSKNSQLTVEGSNFFHNIGPYGGGALHAEGGSVNFSSSNLSFNLNSYYNGGGALFLEEVAGEISNCIFTSNETDANNYGGAVKLVDSSPSFLNCLFQRNGSLKNSAGAIYLDDKSNPIISNNDFRENFALSWGGAIYSQSLELNVTGGLFLKNWSKYGGAIATNGTNKTIFNGVKAYANEANATDNSQGGFLYLGNGANENSFLNCVFSVNKSNYRHGVLSASGESRFDHCTFYGNEAVGSGAVSLLFSGDSIVIDNSILWNNSDANGYEISVNTGSVVISNSLFDSSKSPGTNSDSNSFNYDPLFVDPVGIDGIEGTEDDDLSLTASSPAIDAGSGLLNVDLDGTLRDSKPDLGAYEFFINTKPEYQSEIIFNVSEANSSIAKLLASDADGHSLTFAIGGGNDADSITIDSGNGQLSFVTIPDFEYPNDSDINNRYELSIDISDGFTSIRIDITVVVNDLDESASSPDESMLLINGYLLSGKWRQASWFGSYFSESFPWVYHEIFGWLYIVQEKNGQTWRWKAGQGWLWTDIEIFPFYYQNQFARWAYLGNGEFLGRYYIYQEPEGEWLLIE